MNYPLRQTLQNPLFWEFISDVLTCSNLLLQYPSLLCHWVWHILLTQRGSGQVRLILPILTDEWQKWTVCKRSFWGGQEKQGATLPNPKKPHLRQISP